MARWGETQQPQLGCGRNLVRFVALFGLPVDMASGYWATAAFDYADVLRVRVAPAGAVARHGCP